MTEPLTDAQYRLLEAQLRERLRQVCEEYIKIGYRPADFLSLLTGIGAVAACRTVIASTKIPDGFLRLLNLRRLELTTEATVLGGPWKVLFEDEILEAARHRLRLYKRPDLAKS
jgi:hypothetical protein